MAKRNGMVTDAYDRLHRATFVKAACAGLQITRQEARHAWSRIAKDAEEYKQREMHLRYRAILCEIFVNVSATLSTEVA